LSITEEEEESIFRCVDLGEEQGVDRYWIWHSWFAEGYGSHTMNEDVELQILDDKSTVG